MTTRGGTLANGLTFDNTATVSGGTISLGGTTPTITANYAGTIGSVLAGSSGLATAGLATLTLNGTAVNTFTGGLDVNAGTLLLNFSNLPPTLHELGKYDVQCLNRSTLLLSLVRIIETARRLPEPD